MRYVYLPVVTREKAKKSAIDRLVATFFDGSVKAAAAAFVDPATSALSNEDLKDLERLIREARKERE
jgi:predicted transcriptional regulator